jgi:hypothetical protein
MIKLDQNNNYIKRSPQQAEKKTIKDYFNSSKQKQNQAIAKWLNDSSEALCDL